MDDLLKKLCYKGQERIAVVEPPSTIKKKLENRLAGVQIDPFIDPRYLYDFILVFLHTSEEIYIIGPKAIHNLSPDGKLWIAYRKVASKKYPGQITKEKGWEHFEEAGLKLVSQAGIDKDWSAFRFRNKKFVKSSSKED